MTKQNRHSAISSQAAQHGFTLVEIMISLVVLSLISLGALSAMRTLADTQERLSETTDRVDEMRQVSQFLRQTLRQAKGTASAQASSGWGMVYNNAEPGLVRSEPDEVIWQAPIDSIQGMSGMTYIRLYREGDQLKLQFLPDYQAIEDMQEFAWEQLGDGYVLVSGVEEFTIAYRLDEAGGWLERLDSSSAGLPQAISITIRARERYWPEIVIAPYGALS